MIAEVFQNHGFQLTTALLEFEQKYSGLSLKAGLVEIQFGIISGGGFPFNPNTAVIEFERSETEENFALFTCARTELPITIALDEKGRYYEDGKLLYDSFEEMLSEHEQRILREN